MLQDDACVDVSNFGLNYAVIQGTDCGAASPALGRDILAQGSRQPARRIDRKSDKRPNWAVFVTPLHGRMEPQLVKRCYVEVCLSPLNLLLQS